MRPIDADVLRAELVDIIQMPISEKLSPSSWSEAYTSALRELDRIPTLAYVQQLESRLAQAERERDAALYDLKNSVDACLVCKYFGEECRSRNELNECAFEWRGPCPENTKEAPPCS